MEQIYDTLPCSTLRVSLETEGNGQSHPFAPWSKCKKSLLQNRLTKDTGVKGLSLTFCPRVCLYELLFCGNCKAFGRGKADPDSKISAQCG